MLDWLVALLSLIVDPSPALVSAQSCASCHAAIVADWQKSAHAHAFDNDLFVASYRHDKSAWCVSCHAPLRTSDAFRVEGVGCAVCHIRDGAILGARTPTAEAMNAHRVVVEPRLLRAELCAGCHQFNWATTTKPLRYGPHAMQNTYVEWQHSDAQSCVSCHGAHGVTGGHDVERVRRALDVSVERRENKLRVYLHAHDVGHAVPTGDPFRRLVVQLCASPTCDEPLAEVFFGRRFDEQHRLVADTTVPPNGARERVLERPEGARFYRLVYRYAAVGTERELYDDDREQEIIEGAIRE